MRVTFSQLSTPGLVRPKNEDYLAFWQPQTLEDARSRGALAIIADGVGGQGDGDIASRLAVETALDAFLQAPADTPTSQLISQMFTAANMAVYDSAMQRDVEGKRMATTLTISIFRNAELTIGHVGDCRVYLIHGGRIRRLTSDHSYAGVQLKLGLITVDEAAGSELRSVLTRCLGQDPLVRPDSNSFTIYKDDVIVQCCDGLYCSLSEREIFDIVSKRLAPDACKELIELAEKRGSADNLSVQIVRVEEVEQVARYRGMAVYQPVRKNIMSSEPEVGQVLDNRFQIEDLITRSGMASIFRARDLKDDRTVALKVPFMRFESDPGFFDRFRREEEIGRSLNHPYILRVEPIDPEERSRPYIVMEYLQGQTLGRLMRSVRPMPVGDALRIAARIAEALHYLHDHGIVHRDLKPDNVMITNDGSIRIMDFGIAKVDNSRRLTFGGFQPAMGTPDYMAPEQVKGKRGDARTDIYSLGAILYEMVTGHPPFEAETPLLIMNARLSGDPVHPRRHNSQIPPQVEEIILHAMERNTIDRYPSALAMKEELDHPDAVKLTDRLSRLKPPVLWKSRWRRSRLLILAVIVPLLLWLIFFLITHVKITVK